MPKQNRYILNEDDLYEFKHQILLVLADYQSCKRDEFAFAGKAEDGVVAQGVRLEVTKRIIDNLKLIAKPARPR